jgi:enoyl-CoA hydratase/carnithine racemase
MEKGNQRMSDRVSVTINDQVADVRLNRPDKLNALDTAMFEALVEAGTALAKDGGVRCVVLSGNGRGFCAGLDFASFMAMAGGGDGPARSLLDRPAGTPANFAQHAAHVWTSLPVPVIAAVHGVAFGGGLQIALGADIRVVAPDAQLSVMEIKWGLIPDMTGTQTLRHLVRLDIAKELTFSGRIVSGTEAVSLGLATRGSDRPLETAMTLAREIAAKSPDAIRAGKRLLNAAVGLPLNEGLKLEEETQLALIGKPNQLEAVQANMEKRAPRFADPK